MIVCRIAVGCVMLVIAAVVVPGCSNGNSGDSGSISSDAALNDTAAVEAANVVVEVADKAAFQRVLARHRGKVVLVDFWATWCGPCKEQFPHTVALYREYAEKGLAVVSVSFDDPENKENVQEFLAEHRARFDNLISWQGSSPRSFDAFNIDGAGLPHYQIYDRSGDLVRKISSGDPTSLTPAEQRIDEVIAELLSGE